MPISDEHELSQATLTTADDLLTVARTMKVEELSSLSLPEIERLTSEVARVVPAGNVPGFVLSGLARMSGRMVDPDESRKHVTLLFKGLRQTLGTTLYTAFITGTASVLYGYQQLLRLAGKDPDSAFPEGTWQFYLEFALREDTARHANETIGFHTQLARNNVDIKESDMLAAWLLTTAYFIQQLPDILANEWRERVLLKVLAETVAGDRRKANDYRGLYRQWEQQRPFRRGMDGAFESYATYRARVFENFCKPHLAALRPAERKQIEERMAALENSPTTGGLPAYQRQMSWLAYLQPDTHSETRIHYPFEQAKIGVIWRGHYYLLPLHDVFNVEATRRTAAAILADTPDTPPAGLDDLLLAAPRAEQPNLRKLVDTGGTLELDLLRFAPVLINWDQQNANQPLSYIRQAKRGVGDHPLTIIRTQESFVFDQSHIFFDGAWGAAVAEMMTNEALSWAFYLSTQPAVRRAQNPPPPLRLSVNQRLQKTGAKARLPIEASAETTALHMDAIVALRGALKQRSDLAQVTVNDLLILYRGLHALVYQLSPEIETYLAALKKQRTVAAQQAYQITREVLDRTINKNPAILIPIDASRHAPHDRVYPTTFRNPLTDFFDHHRTALDALHRFRMARDKTTQRAFEEAQATYLRMVGGFGELLTRYKDIALRGQSTSTASIKLMARVPEPLQRLLNSIPGKLDLLNEIIKGEEVFSNIGRVTPDSTLRRFITAKDDNQQKMFAWGVMTDAQNIVHLSLRDFRPHIPALHAAGAGELAQLIVQDYLNAYANGLNAYVAELREIAIMRTGRKG